MAVAVEFFGSKHQSAVIGTWFQQQFSASQASLVVLVAQAQGASQVQPRDDKKAFVSLFTFWHCMLASPPPSFEYKQ